MAGITGTLARLYGVNQQGIVALFGKIVTGTSGAVSSYDFPGVTVTKTATKTGRYTLALPRKSVEFLGGIATLIADDDSAITTASGANWAFRDDDIASDGTIELQWVRSDTAADAEVTNDSTFYVLIFIKDSSV
jgi:hypothetical protein